MVRSLLKIHIAFFCMLIVTYARTPFYAYQKEMQELAFILFNIL